MLLNRPFSSRKAVSCRNTILLVREESSKKAVTYDKLLLQYEVLKQHMDDCIKFTLLSVWFLIIVKKLGLKTK